MARIIPNENTWVGYSASIGDINAPTSSEIGLAEDWTCWLISINASSQGNTIPTPQLCTLFETTVAGTSSAQFSADFYRDDADDSPWETLVRGTQGFMIISRFPGPVGTDALPIAGDSVEVWPIEVTSRTAGALTSNTVQMFTATCAVNVEPSESATVA